MATGKDEKVHKKSALKALLIFSILTLALFASLKAHLPSYFWNVTTSIIGTEKLLYEIKDNGVHVGAGLTSEAKTAEILLSEVFLGSNALPPFIELYNAGDTSIDLTGFSLKRLSASGTETTFITSKRFENMLVNQHEYVLIAKSSSTLSADIYWPASYAMAKTNSSLRLYNPSNKMIDEVSWNSIPENSSLTRIAWDKNDFTLIDPPTPQSKDSR